MNETKECPYCRTDVRIDAIKCPSCREWLNKKELSVKNPYVQAIFFMTFFFGIYLLFQNYMVEKTSSFYKKVEGINYSPNRKLRILSQRLIKDKSVYRIVGEIKNEENFKWNSVELVAIFKNKKNEIMFLSSSYIQDLKPGETKYFQTTGPCSEIPLNVEGYGSYELIIDSASARL